MINTSPAPNILKTVLELSALILSIINGLMLLRAYLRDRAILKVSPIHRDVYQWWFRLPDSEYQGRQTRKYGFLVYIGVTNKGLRQVQLEKWRLTIRSSGFKSNELRPLSIPEPSCSNEVFTKIYPVLGQKGLAFGGNTLVESGRSISGMVYFVYECYGDRTFDPRINNNIIRGTFEAKSVFGKSAKCAIDFACKDLAYIQTIFYDIEKIY